jgi:hypothetical protein
MITEGITKVAEIDTQKPMIIITIIMKEGIIIIRKSDSRIIITVITNTRKSIQTHFRKITINNTTLIMTIRTNTQRLI